MSTRALPRPQRSTPAASSRQRVNCPCCGKRNFDAARGTVVRLRVVNDERDALDTSDVVKCRRCNTIFEIVRALPAAA